MIEYYNRQGEPITREEALPLFTNYEYKVIDQTTLPGGVWVSTVWLGLDHNFTDHGPPLIFETMVFPSQDNLLEEDCDRYTTEEQARDGHQRMVTKWTGWTPGDPRPEETT